MLKNWVVLGESRGEVQAHCVAVALDIEDFERPTKDCLNLLG